VTGRHRRFIKLTSNPLRFRGMFILGEQIMASRPRGAVGRFGRRMIETALAALLIAASTGIASAQQRLFFWR